MCLYIPVGQFRSCSVFVAIVLFEGVFLLFTDAVCLDFSDVSHVDQRAQDVTTFRRRISCFAFYFKMLRFHVTTTFS